MICAESKDCISVADFYNGKSIFVTGGTGFLGKLLIEKILWSCPEIENIYLLLRAKKSEDERSRLATLLRNPIFERLRKTKPHDLKKIIPIAGDLSKPHMNICQADKGTLMNKVSVVFHIAATVRFNEPVKEALTVNAVGTDYLLQFCQQMHNIKVFVYVSTAFSNCNRKEVKEEIYNLPRDPEKIIGLMDILTDEIADKLTPLLIEEYPNTYTFSKAVAENMLLKYCTKIPITVVRPSIVLSSIQEPIPGWIDSWNGATSNVAGALKGLIHGIFGDGSLVAPLIPADIVVNLTICVAWRAANISGTRNIEVYNCCSGHLNPLTWGEFAQYCSLLILKNPAEGLLSYPWFLWQNHKMSRFFQSYLLERVPAYAIDCMTYFTGNNTSLVKYHRKLMEAQDILTYFLTRKWTFLGNNMQLLSDSLSENDRQIFPFDVRRIHWPTYLENYYLGVRHYLLKNNPDSLVECRNRLKMLKWIHWCIPSFLLMFIVYLVFTL